MKIVLPLLLALSVSASCEPKSPNPKTENSVRISDTVVIHDTVYIDNNYGWQKGWTLSHDIDKDSIAEKPVRFYLDNKNCAPVAADFYYGAFKPTDNLTTAYLLSLVTTKDNSLRPFYRWILNMTIQIQDGALGEYTGIPARQYAEKYPEEFFEYMDRDSSGQRYRSWVNSILYSGFYDIDNSEKPKEIQQKMAKMMKKNCVNCSVEISGKIEKFTNDCFTNGYEL